MIKCTSCTDPLGDPGEVQWGTKYNKVGKGRKFLMYHKIKRGKWKGEVKRKQCGKCRIRNVKVHIPIALGRIVAIGIDIGEVSDLIRPTQSVMYVPLQVNFFF